MMAWASGQGWDKQLVEWSGLDFRPESPSSSNANASYSFILTMNPAMHQWVLD
jgi:hypothetical protein